MGNHFMPHQCSPKPTSFFRFAHIAPAFLALLLGTAHLWRAGLYGLALSCMGFACLLWTGLAWVRLVGMVLTSCLVVRWAWVSFSLAEMRIMRGEPWMRLACILGGVALFTLFASWLLWRQKTRTVFQKNKETALLSASAFMLVFLSFGILSLKAPHVLLLYRVAPAYALLQGFAFALWAAFIAHKLHDSRTMPSVRMRIWRLFSCVFFGQLVLGLLGYSIFLLSGSLHLPIPGLIVASPLYRGGGYFMISLFAVSLFLVGSAWCSHLCYFGVWDATMADIQKKRRTQNNRPPQWLPYIHYGTFVLTVMLALLLRFLGAPTENALMAGLVLGLLFIPCTVFISARYGVNGYCLSACPLGLLATRLRFLQPWRLILGESCTKCQKCFRACPSMALDSVALEKKVAHHTCTLCGNCISACPHDACHIHCTYYPLSPQKAHSVLTVFLATLHSLFLGVAMI